MGKRVCLGGTALAFGLLAGCGEQRGTAETAAAFAHAAVSQPTVSPEFGFAAPIAEEEAGGQPRIACGVSRCLLAFFVADAVFATRMSKSGTALDATPIFLGSASTSNHSLAVTARGDEEFAVAWLPYVGSQVAHVRRIGSSNGALLESRPAEVGPASEYLALGSDGAGYALVSRHQPGFNSWQTRAHFFRNGAWQANSLLLEDGANMYGRTAVGFGAGKYLLAWGNAEATRIDAASGAVLDAQPITYTALEPGTSQSVVFDGQNFFISWHSGELRGARIRASDGVVLDVDDTFNQIAKSILIRDDALQRLFPTSTWDGTHAVVFWTSLQSGSAVLEAARIDTLNGRRVDGSNGSAPEFTLGTLASAMSTSDFFPSWALGYGSTGGFLAYARNGAGIRSRTLAREAAGAPRLEASERVISNGSIDQQNLAVASNGNRYLIAWTDLRTPGSTRQDLYCARLSASGAMLDPSGVLLAQDVTDPVVASAGGDYLVTWRSGAELLGRTVSDATGGAGAVRQIASSVSGHVVASDDVRYLVAWRAGGAVYARRVSATGTALDADPLEIGYTTGAIDAAGDHHPDPALRSFGVAYANKDALTVSVRAVRSATGAVITPEVSVTSRNEPAAGVTLSSDGRRFVLAWLQARFDADYAIVAAAYDPYANALVEGETLWALQNFAGQVPTLPPPLVVHDGIHHLSFRARSSGLGDGKNTLWARRMTTALTAIDDGDGFAIDDTLPTKTYIDDGFYTPIVRFTSNSKGRTLVAYIDSIIATGEIGRRVRARFIDNAEAGDAGLDGSSTPPEAAPEAAPDSTSQPDALPDSSSAGTGGSGGSGAAVSDAGHDATGGSSGAGSSGTGGANAGGSAGTGDGGAGTTGSGGTTGNPEMDGSAGTSGVRPRPQPSSDDSGCACRTAGARHQQLALFAALALLAPIGRRLTRRSRASRVLRKFTSCKGAARP